MQCLFLHSNLFHVFWLSISQEKQQLHTLTIFPDTVAWRSDTEDGKYHSEAKLCKDRSANVLQSTQGTPKGVCHVVGESVLPTPDTAAFVQKMEREKRAKQHGADADNRSFLAKYVRRKWCGKFDVFAPENSGKNGQNREFLAEKLIFRLKKWVFTDFFPKFCFLLVKILRN